MTKEELLALAVKYPPNMSYHSNSWTHICYSKWFRPFGIRGVGVFPQEAMEAYHKAVRDELESASEETLAFWSDFAPELTTSLGTFTRIEEHKGNGVGEVQFEECIWELTTEKGLHVLEYHQENFYRWVLTTPTGDKFREASRNKCIDLYVNHVPAPPSPNQNWKEVFTP